MAVAPLQLPQVGPISQAPFDFSQLSKLGDIYAQQSALSQLGNDPTANAQALIKSGVPSLAQLGINLQQQQATSAENVREFNLQQKIREHQDARAAAAERRAAETYAKQDSDEAAAARLIDALRQQQAPQAPQAAPQAFPAPLPQGSPQLPPQVAPGTSPIAPSAMQAQMPQPAAPPPPQATLPQAPAPDATASPIAPSQLDATAGIHAIADRAATNLASGQGAPTAGISNDQLGELFRNPLTRPLATTLLQNQLSPGTWKVEKGEDGRLLAYNDKTLQSRDITPPTPTGAQPASKQEREYQGYFQAGKNLGMNDQDAAAFAANKGKAPRQDLSATEEKMVEDRTKQIHAGEDVMANISRLQELNKTAYSGLGASKRAAILQAILPDAMVPQGAIDTTEYENTALQNVARQAKETFGARLAVAEVKLLNEIETNPLQSPSARKAILDRLQQMFQRHLNDATDEREAIRNKSFFKPTAPQAGGAASAAPATPQPQAAAPTNLAKPPDRIVNKARAAIYQGADKNQVRQHMIDNGYDPGDIGQ